MSEQELYHAWVKKGQAKDDHKYIKREWKNGRWQYTYPSASAAKTKTTNVAKPKTIRENTNKSLSTADKFKRAINTAKDKLGVDERAEYKKTKAAWDKAVDKRNEADSKIDNFNEANKYTRYDKYDYDRSNELHSDYQFWRNTAEKRGREFMEARAAYIKTPMGQLVKAKDFIDDVAFDVSYGVEKAVDKAKDVGKDIAWEVESAFDDVGDAVKKSIGISQKRELNRATAALEQNKKARRIPYPNATERVLAELRQKDVEKRYRDAVYAYSGTPLQHIETGMD